jgi:branched-chain amino acid transport system substrate-binding protein
VNRVNAQEETSVKLFKQVLVLVVCGAFVAACGSSSNDKSAGSGGTATAASGGTISAKVGLVDDVTGPLAFVGLEQQRAAKLAVDDVNKSNLGVKLTTVAKDAQSKPAGAVTAVQSLLSDSGVAGIVGFDETESGNGAMPLLARDGRPALMLQVTKLDKRPDNVVSMGPPTARVAKLAIDKVVAKRGVHRVGLIWVQQPTLTEAAVTFKNELKAAGIDVVADEGATLTTTNFDSQISKVIAAKPDAIGISGLSPQDGTILAGLKAHGYKGLVFAQQAADSPTTRKAAGDAFNGLVIGTYWDTAAANADADRLLAAWKAAYPSDPAPDVYGVQAWDAVHILARAIKNAGSTDKAKVVQALTSGSFAAALQDTISFGPDGFASLEGYVVEMTATGAKVLARPGQ